MPDFKKLIARLKKRHGESALPRARGPFELVMWENACYLLPDEQRAAVLEGLRTEVRRTAEAILYASGHTLLALAKMGGMRPETRVFRWREIARITKSQFDGVFTRRRRTYDLLPSRLCATLRESNCSKRSRWVLLFCARRTRTDGYRYGGRRGYARQSCAMTATAAYNGGEES